MANNDWRLQVDFREDGVADTLQDRLDAAELEHDLSEAFHDRVIVSRDEIEAEGDVRKPFAFLGGLAG